MSQSSGRKERLHRLIDFARVYRGWNRVETARALHRDSTKLYPRTDNPKMDILVGLAGVLDWSVNDIVDYIWNGDARPTAPADHDFEQLDQQAGAAHRAGQYRQMVDLAVAMFRVAETPEQRARACNREHGAWDGLGRYPKALEAACRGLRESPLPIERRHQLQGNLANTHYTLWELTSAIAHAHVIIEWYQQHPPETVNQRKRQAFATYVRGHAHRRLGGQPSDGRVQHCERAAEDLRQSITQYETLAAGLDDPRLAGIAHTCRGGLLEVEVELARTSPAAAVETYLEALDRVVDPAAVEVGDWLESHGWWCVFGANIALRHLEGRGLQQAMAVFTNKALEIADRLDNWALRERVFSVQYSLHEKLVDATGLELPYLVDEEDKRLITGTMGRFPNFRDTGWRIFRAARIIEPSGRN